MKTVMLRHLEIGTGCPKIIVPIVAKTAEDILAKGKELTDYTIDVVEWRADFYDAVFDIGQVVLTAKALRDVLGETPLLFTFRTKKEGGEKDIDMDTYAQLCQAVAKSGYADAIDVEIFSGDDIVVKIIADIHEAGKIVIGSNHNFSKTPDKADLLNRLRKMQDLDSDISKIAVMPQNSADVITLMDATQTMMTQYADRPIITMSMGSAGVITRIAGEVFGSSMTFGAVGQASAPGQISVDQLQYALNILHSAL
ncbi:MAG TPA: type I 3-dehydroquinate dehydratase [Clostridia bacterium]|nr:type I 3-dehydroquinate dehydratase [Clostridia bacterium]